MTTPHSTDHPVEEPPAKRPRSRLFGCATIIGGLFGAGILTLVGVWLYSSQKRAAELAEQVARVRARGEPLTTVELNDFYVAAKDRPDMTQEIIKALAICDEPELKKEAEHLPVVGKGPEIPAPPNEWPQLEKAEEYLSRLAVALDIFREVSRREGTARFPVDFSLGIGTPLPLIQSSRQSARVLSMQVHVHLHRGKISAAVDGILHELALARTLDQEPDLISQLVQVALVAVAVSDIQRVSNAVNVSEADLLKLQKGLRKLEFQQCLVRALAGERAMGYMACIDPLRMGGDGTAPVTPAEAREIAQRPPQRIRDAAKMLELNLQVAEAAEQSLFAALQESVRVDVEVHSLAKSLPSRFYYTLTLQMSPAYHSMTMAFARAAAKRDSTDAAIAAELYRRQHGKWPESLEQLVPQYLPAVPVDPFDNQPLKMVSTPGEFKVYSVGKDGRDDGGKLSDQDEPNTDRGFAMPVRSGE